MENLEMSGNLTAVRETSGILLKVREMSRKSCQKLFIVSCIFASTLDFAEFVHFVLVSDHVLLHSYPTTDTNTSTGMIWVTLNMGRSAANRQGTSHCLVGGHPGNCWQESRHCWPASYSLTKQETELSQTDCAPAVHTVPTVNFLVGGGLIGEEAYGTLVAVAAAVSINFSVG